MGVRLDQALHRLCLTKSRSAAGRACQEGRIRVNGERAKPSREIHPGDRIMLEDAVRGRVRVIVVDEPPPRQLSRREAPACYHVLDEASDERRAAQEGDDDPVRGRL